ncbi:MAG: 4-hydroxy-tetrahydrodipicolinate synthase [Clostridia bacterium]|nr:4-hydroxy-tetrahydrodipicolinate synthase [Clostridia bacterium]
MLFQGSGVALITPFDPYGNVNYAKLEELIEFQILNQTDAIIVCGTTGESSTLSTEEKKDVISFVTKKVNKRIPVIAGTGTNNTKTSIEMSKFAESVSVDGLLLVTPYYNKTTQEGLYAHFNAIASSVSIPIILYNVPSRTGLNISVDTVLKLSKIKNIVGIKEASGDISQVAQIASKVDSSFAIYSGNDDQIVPILSLGGVGVISVLANIFPKETHDICNSFLNGDITKSRRLQFRYLDLIKQLFIEVNPIPIKEAMNILDFGVGSCRLPLCNMETKNKKILTNVLKNI